MGIPLETGRVALSSRAPALGAILDPPARIGCDNRHREHRRDESNGALRNASHFEEPRSRASAPDRATASRASPTRTAISGRPSGKTAPTPRCASNTRVRTRWRPATRSRSRMEVGATEQKHRFVRRGVPSMLRLQRKTLGEPRANEKYLLEIDGEGEAERSDSPRRGYGDRVHRLQPHARRVLRYEGTRPAADRGGLPGRADDASTAIGRRRRIQSRSAWPFDQGCSRFTPSSKRPCPTPGR